MNEKTQVNIKKAVGITAFFIGGILAKSASEENVDKLFNVFSKKQTEVADPLAPPPQASSSDEPSI